MGLISAIKSLLGIGNTRDRSRERPGGTDVTVEREPDATSERAVKESGAKTADTGDAVDTDEGADTDEETGADEGADVDEGVDADEEADADEETGTDGDAELTFENEPDTAGGDASGATGEEPDGEERETGGNPVEEIKGIGPAYAERLGEAGVHTVSDLADADAADLGEATGLGENRVQGWIDRAKAR
jgi:predicted flap endonuclease-1-like 5' DNA nuclease